MANFVSRNVSVVDLTTDTVIATVPTSDLPAPGSQGETNLVGAEMFFSSRGNFDAIPGTNSLRDRLSSEGWQSCASCHFKGLTDGVIWQFAAGPRKSVPLNATFSPHKRTEQRVLNYSAIFDEIEDFEANIRNVSGPGPLLAHERHALDPNHGLLIGPGGDLNVPPTAVNAFALANANRDQVTVTLPGSANKVPALDRHAGMGPQRRPHPQRPVAEPARLAPAVLHHFGPVAFPHRRLRQLPRRHQLDGQRQGLHLAAGRLRNFHRAHGHVHRQPRRRAIFGPFPARCRLVQPGSPGPGQPLPAQHRGG